MKKTNKEWSKDADEWFYDLGAMAKRIQLNETRHIKARKRQNIIFAFVTFAFFLLAYRSETNSNRIETNSIELSRQQTADVNRQIQACASGLLIIQKYNTLLDDLIKIESNNTFVDDSIRKQRITSYESAKITPTPTCDRFNGSGR